MLGWKTIWCKGTYGIPYVQTKSIHAHRAELSMTVQLRIKMSFLFPEILKSIWFHPVRSAFEILVKTFIFDIFFSI